MGPAGAGHAEQSDHAAIRGPRLLRPVEQGVVEDRVVGACYF